MGRLDGKVAVVTGAGTGIGRATMVVFAREGAKVVGVSRTQANLDETLALVTEIGGEGVVIAADLAEDAGAEETVSAAVSAYGGIDVLVTCAGVGYAWGESHPGTMEDVAETTPEAWRDIMALNLDSVFYILRWAIPEMRKRGGGAIVNVTSISGMLGLPVAHTYTAAKGAAINLTRSLCVAYAKDNIRSNSVVPGWVSTPMVAPLLELFDDPEGAEQVTPAARPGTPEEMANACLFLASDEASYCNGTVLVVDGGQSARQ
jgi:NAD(P)-dependent dehydrogenase (short-subunit alcohol dehydrogenase family)